MTRRTPRSTLFPYTTLFRSSPTYKGGQINTAPDMSFGRLAGKEIGVHCVAIRPSSSSNLTALVATRQSRLPRKSLHLAVHCRSCCNGRLRPRSPCRAETDRSARLSRTRGTTPNRSPTPCYPGERLSARGAARVCHRRYGLHRTAPG